MGAANHSAGAAPAAAYPPGPVLAVCGWSGSGKTTLLEAVIPRLMACGLRVAVLKHDAHGPDVDRPGKDSDRLFHAGADVLVVGPGEAFERRRSDGRSGAAAVAALLRCHDLVLVEGLKGTPLPKVWLARPGEPDLPAGVANVLAVLPWDAQRAGALLELVDRWLPRAWASVPLWAGILIGGGSTRMGRPKHLLERGGRTWTEHLAAALSPCVAGVALLGSGELPAALAPLPCLPDVPDVRGPLAGMLAAMRWQPHAAWVIAACDLPLVDEAAVRWLLAERRPGRWAVLPGRSEEELEPLFALYEPQARALLEAVAAGDSPAPRLVAPHPKVATPAPPASLRRALANVNVPADLGGLGVE